MLITVEINQIAKMKMIIKLINTANTQKHAETEWRER